MGGGGVFLLIFRNYVSLCGEVAKWCINDPPLKILAQSVNVLRLQNGIYFSEGIQWE